jgi:CII-binding regulator of phage lambda lysogenization HflD
MSYELEGEREYQTEVAPDIGPLPSSRRITIVIYMVLALIGIGAAVLWHQYHGALEGLPTFKSETSPQAVSLKSFDDYQRAVAENLRRHDEMLQAQDAEIKRLTDQVLQLITNMYSLESRIRDAQAAIPSVPKQASKKATAKLPTFTPVRKEK